MKNSDYAKSIFHAAHQGKLNDVKAMVENGTSVNAHRVVSGKIVGSVLESAIRSGNVELVKYVIMKGADVNLVDDFKYTPLIYALALYDTKKKQSLEISKLLIENGALIDVGRSYLLFVQDFDMDGELTKMLIENKADVNYVDQDSSYHTPLMAAIILCHPNNVMKLVGAGASVRLTVDGNDAYQIAKMYMELYPGDKDYEKIFKFISSAI